MSSGIRVYSSPIPLLSLYQLFNGFINRHKINELLETRRWTLHNLLFTVFSFTTSLLGQKSKNGSDCLGLLSDFSGQELYIWLNRGHWFRYNFRIEIVFSRAALCFWFYENQHTWSFSTKWLGHVPWPFSALIFPSSIEWYICWLKFDLWVCLWKFASNSLSIPTTTNGEDMINSGQCFEWNDMAHASQLPAQQQQQQNLIESQVMRRKTRRSSSY